MGVERLGGRVYHRVLVASGDDELQKSAIEWEIERL